jgi:hypothetical protein
MTNVEIYKAIGVRVPSQCIKGIQRIRDMWRIYMDNEEDRLSLLVQGLVLRDRQIPLHSQNPYNPGRAKPDTIRILWNTRAQYLPICSFLGIGFFNVLLIISLSPVSQFFIHKIHIILDEHNQTP